jgi:hypothetical protein
MGLARRALEGLMDTYWAGVARKSLGTYGMHVVNALQQIPETSTCLSANANMGTVKVLIIDHYDSYTNNILQLLQGSQPDQDGNLYPEWSVTIIRFDQFNWYECSFGP